MLHTHLYTHIHPQEINVFKLVLFQTTFLNSVPYSNCIVLFFVSFRFNLNSIPHFNISFQFNSNLIPTYIYICVCHKIVKTEYESTRSKCVLGLRCANVNKTGLVLKHLQIDSQNTDTPTQ